MKKKASAPTLQQALEQLKNAERLISEVKEGLHVLIEPGKTNLPVSLPEFASDVLAPLTAIASGHALAAASEMKRWAKAQPKPEASSTADAVPESITPPNPVKPGSDGACDPFGNPWD